MPWPKDPERQELARQRMREASAKRWLRPEEHERQRRNAFKQFSDPEMRQRMSEIKKEQVRKNPALLRHLDAIRPNKPRAVPVLRPQPRPKNRKRLKLIMKRAEKRERELRRQSMESLRVRDSEGAGEREFEMPDLHTVAETGSAPHAHQ